MLAARRPREASLSCWARWFTAAASSMNTTVPSPPPAPMAANDTTTRSALAAWPRICDGRSGCARQPCHALASSGARVSSESPGFHPARPSSCCAEPFISCTLPCASSARIPDCMRWMMCSLRRARCARSTSRRAASASLRRRRCADAEMTRLVAKNESPSSAAWVYCGSVAGSYRYTQVCWVSTAIVASAANSTAMRPDIRMLPAATVITSSRPKPLDSPPLACVTSDMTTMSTNTCAGACTSMLGARRAAETSASTANAR